MAAAGVCGCEGYQEAGHHSVWPGRLNATPDPFPLISFGPVCQLLLVLFSVHMIYEGGGAKTIDAGV